MELYVPCQRRLYAHILLLVGNPMIAHDLLQDTNLVVVAEVRAVPAGNQFLRLGPRGGTVLRLAVPAVAVPRRLAVDPALLDGVEEGASAEDSDRLYADALAGCLGKLKHEDADLLRYRYSGNFSVQLLARQLGRSQNAISQALSRIRRALKLCIEHTRPLKDEMGGITYGSQNARRPPRVRVAAWADPRCRRIAEDRLALRTLLAERAELRSQYVAWMRLHANLSWRFMPGKPLSPDELQRYAVAEAIADEAMPDSLAQQEATQLDLGTGLAAGNTADDGPRRSPILGFLGDVGRQGWGYVSSHSAFFSVLAVLVAVTALVAVAVRNENFGGPDAATQSEVADLNSESSSGKSEIPNAVAGTERQLSRGRRAGGERRPARAHERLPLERPGVRPADRPAATGRSVAAPDRGRGRDRLRRRRQGHPCKARPPSSCFRPTPPGWNWAKPRSRLRPKRPAASRSSRPRPPSSIGAPSLASK